MCGTYQYNKYGGNTWMKVEVILSVLWNTTEFLNKTTAHVNGPFARPNNTANNLSFSGNALKTERLMFVVRNLCINWSSSRLLIGTYLWLGKYCDILYEWESNLWHVCHVWESIVYPRIHIDGMTVCPPPPTHKKKRSVV